MRSVPRWFLRELRIIDPSLRVDYVSESNMFILSKELDYVIDGKPKKERFIRASFRYLNDKALDNLRYRKRLGERLMDRPGAYIRWLHEEEVENKKKLRDEAIDMMTEGYVKAHKLKTSRTFS